LCRKIISHYHNNLQNFVEFVQWLWKCLLL
jgi:hypothetical protein